MWEMLKQKLMYSYKNVVGGTPYWVGRQFVDSKPSNLASFSFYKRTTVPPGSMMH